jgi:hypothetical protein
MYWPREAESTTVASSEDADGGVVGVVERGQVAQAWQTLAAWALLHGVGPPVAVGGARSQRRGRPVLTLFCTPRRSSMRCWRP